jgi:hypothetical protein
MKLRAAVQTRGDKNWAEIATLVPGRTKFQCSSRWLAVDLVTDSHPNAGATATGSWTLKEDAELNSAIAKTSKSRWGKESKRDWIAIAALVSGRTKNQCRKRWRDALDPRITLTAKLKTKTSS